MVEELGDAAAERWGVNAGQRVAVEVFLSCRNCDQCRAGLYRRCERNGLATMVGFTDADTAPGLGGGYASHLYLRPDSMLMAVPDELDPVTATLFNPLGAGIRWAVEIPDTQPGDVVAILGPGVQAAHDRERCVSGCLQGVNLGLGLPGELGVVGRYCR